MKTFLNNHEVLFKIAESVEKLTGDSILEQFYHQSKSLTLIQIEKALYKLINSQKYQHEPLLIKTEIEMIFKDECKKLYGTVDSGSETLFDNIIKRLEEKIIIKKLDK